MFVRNINLQPSVRNINSYKVYSMDSVPVDMQRPGQQPEEGEGGQDERVHDQNQVRDKARDPPVQCFFGSVPFRIQPFTVFCCRSRSGPSPKIKTVSEQNRITARPFMYF